VPRDGSVIVSFSEPVDVDPGWYDITCVTIGNHNDATVAAGATNSWVIIPNTNFLAGETCTATVFATFVHEVGPGTNLPTDQSWSFSIATGSAPPYPPSVHLTMGTPSVCVADLLSPNSYLMLKPEMSICYNRGLGRPNWVSWHLTDEWNGTLPRNDTFRADPMVPPAWYRVLGTDFSFSGFDRGHMCPNADRDLQTSIPINQATYLMSNMVAQAPDNNQGPWAALENYIRTFEPANEMYIISGPNGVGGSGSNGGTTTTLANGNVTVPASTWKVVMFLPKASGDDVARVTAATHTLAVIMPNVQGIRNNDWHMYLTTVDAVEALTGYDFFSNVPPAIQAAIEGGVDGVNPPGTANQSTSTNEDVAEAITLDAASPGGSLTYSIVSGPSHGNLTGSGANRTYTPAPDFNGTDTFTWRVNDGTNDSNTSTMTITVLEVNDPPTATDDSKSTTANNALTFPASDLTTNDSTGPANESSQTLTVSSVTPTANTHGTVSLSSGMVTYTPAAGYSGPASFTYSVCDDGVTVGLADPKCTTATVNVAVDPQVTTHFTVSAPPTVTAGVPFNVIVTALDAGNSTVTSYTGTVHFTSSSAGTFPADYTFSGGDSGTKTFSVTLTTTGSRSVTATDTGNGSINGSTNTIVTAAPATHFSVTAPSGVTTGLPFNVTVTALDASNATVTGYTGTVHFTSSSAGTLPADYTFTGGDAGAHTFSVTLTTLGLQSINAGDGSISGSANTTVSATPATHFSVTAPSNVTSGVAFNSTVTALDAGNATVTGYTGTVHFTSSSTGTLPADYTFAAGDNGAHTFSVTLTATGAQTITATETGNGSINGTANTTVACPALSVTASNDGPGCIGGSVQLNASTAAGSVTYAWTGPGGFTSTLQNPSVTVAGTYNVTITAPGGCTASSSTSVSFASAPPVTITTPSTICAFAPNTATVPSAGAGATYNWTVPGGTIVTGAGTNAITYSAPAGSLTIGVSILTSGGCSGSGSTTVTVKPRPTVTIPATIAVCGPQTVSIPVTLTGTGPWTIYWSDGFSQTSATATTTRSYNATTTVTLGIQTVTDASCTASVPSPNTLQITVNNPPVITTQPHDTFVPGGSPVTFTVAATGDGLHYQWYLQDGNNGSSHPVGTDSATFTLDPVHGNFQIWVVVTNGCGNVESIHVQGGVETSRHRIAPH
jgi:DNA/RNA endonuclease G (NUC1)